jgi:protocatechuate 3,4-dioxygenase beta subunit
VRRSGIVVGALALALAGAAAFVLVGRHAGDEEPVVGTREGKVERHEAGLQARPAPTPEGIADGEPTFAIRGIVVDEADHPVAGVRVEATVEPGGTSTLDSAWAPAPSRVPFETTRSSEDGTFRIERVPLTRTIAVTALGTDSLASAYEVVHPWEFVRLRLVPGRALGLRVVGRGGVGVPAVVSAALSGDDWMGRVSWRLVETDTDAEGRLRLPVVPNGTLSFSVRVPGRGSRDGIRVRTPAEGEVLLRVEEDAGATVEGEVKDTGGRPVARARVAVTSRSRAPISSATRVATTDDRGTYRVDGLAPGLVGGIDVEAPGFVRARNLHAGLEAV